MTHDVQALRKEAHAWAVKLKTGRPSATDVAAFKRWRDASPAHAQAWSQAAHDWLAVDEATGDFLASRALAQPPAARARLARRLFVGTALAGGGALAVAGVFHPLLGMWPSLPEWGADYRTGVGEQRDIRLGEAIRLALNTRTSVAVSEQVGLARVTLIAGEAAVLARDAPCEIQAGGASLRIERGEVEVRQLGDRRVSVVCRDGTAQLRHPLRAVPLAAGQQVVYDAAQVSAPGRSRAAQSAWREGMVVFEDMPLAEVVEEINRYRPGRVVLVGKAVATRRFSARFKISGLDEAIDLLQAAHAVQVRRIGDLVLLS